MAEMKCAPKKNGAMKNSVKYNVRLFSKLEVDGAFKLNRKNRYKGARNSDATVKRKQRPHAIEAQWIKVVVFQC